LCIEENVKYNKVRMKVTNRFKARQLHLNATLGYENYSLFKAPRAMNTSNEMTGVCTFLKACSHRHSAKKQDLI